MTNGVHILKQLEEDDGYVPACGIYVSGTTAEISTLIIEIYLPREVMDADLDRLRFALKGWSSECKFGNLAETGV